MAEVEDAVSEENIPELDTLTFDGNVTQHVQLLLDLPEQVFKDFCRLSLDFLHNGYNQKRYDTAAEKLNTSAKDITNAVNGIVYLLMNACKHQLNDADFTSTLTEIGFSEVNAQVLVKFYNAKKDSIQQALSKFNLDLPMFHNLDWRLEVQVASRSLPEQIIPTVCMNFAISNYKVTKVKVNGSDGEESTEIEEPTKVITNKVLYCDIPNLENMIENLEMALRETKNYQVKKLRSAIIKD